MASAILTALFFSAGNEILSYFLMKFSFASWYGASGSAVVILTWTYYSSLILYFGAELTKAFQLHYTEKTKVTRRAKKTK
jgi:membrane protein